MAVQGILVSVRAVLAAAGRSPAGGMPRVRHFPAATNTPPWMGLESHARSACFRWGGGDAATAMCVRLEFNARSACFRRGRGGAATATLVGLELQVRSACFQRGGYPATATRVRLESEVRSACLRQRRGGASTTTCVRLEFHARSPCCRWERRGAAIATWAGQEFQARSACFRWGRGDATAPATATTTTFNGIVIFTATVAAVATGRARGSRICRLVELERHVGVPSMRVVQRSVGPLASQGGRFERGGVLPRYGCGCCGCTAAAASTAAG